MMRLLFLLGMALQDDPKVLEQTIREHAREMRQECAAALEAVDGVAAVGVGGSGTDYRLLIAVRDAATQRRVRSLVGDAYGGIRILWSVAPTPRRPGLPEGLPEPPRLPAPGPAPDRLDPGNASALDCDIIRDHLRLTPVLHPAGNGTSWAPCQILTRPPLGSGGGPSVRTPNHRPDCPIRLGRAGELPGSDDFVTWVIRQGSSPPAGEPWTLASPEGTGGVPPPPPVWIGGYGWVSPAVPVLPGTIPPAVSPSRPWWPRHLWIPLRGCHPWHLHR